MPNPNAPAKAFFDETILEIANMRRRMFNLEDLTDVSQVEDRNQILIRNEIMAVVKNYQKYETKGTA